MEEAGRRESSEGCRGKEGRCCVACSEDGGRGPQAQGYKWPLGTGKGKDVASPWSPADPLISPGETWVGPTELGDNKSVLF